MLRTGALILALLMLAPTWSGEASDKAVLIELPLGSAAQPTGVGATAGRGIDPGPAGAAGEVQLGDAVGGALTGFGGIALRASAKLASAGSLLKAAGSLLTGL